jgi:tetratricopeptide (TPR) repeat protein/predicted Ser/Thr protein kinase
MSTVEDGPIERDRDEPAPRAARDEVGVTTLEDGPLEHEPLEHEPLEHERDEPIAPADPSTPGELDTMAAEGGGQRSAEVEETPLPRGAGLGRYLVLERLGMGGMGVVYAAYDPQLDRKVALKLVRPSRTQGRAQEVRARLLREAKAMARLSHPNVVTVHDMGTMDDQVFVAMEFIEGLSLRRWAQQAAPGWPGRLEVMRGAGRGLAVAHAKGLMHRDFKPDNVMVERGGRVVVMDFGLARGLARPTEAEHEAEAPNAKRRSSGRLAGLPHETPIELTVAGSMMGTPAYMAPEQFAGTGIDARSDQFAFCVTLYELLYGERPFGGEGIHSLMSAVVGGRLEPEPRAAGVPRWLRRVVLRGLSTEPEQRWPSMDALLVALAQDPSRRRRPWLWLGGVLGLGAGLVGAGMWARDRDHARGIERCEQEGRAIEQTWSPAHRERLRASLLVAAGPHADESFARVVSWLDGWTASWARERADVCRQAEVEGTLDPELYAHAQACSEEQRIRLVAMLEVYEHAEPGMLAGAVESAAGLTQLDSCADPRLLAQRTVPPDSASPAIIASVRSSLSRASALADAGRYADGLAQARRALAEAEGLGWAPLQAEARMTAAGVQAELGQYDEVREALQLAFGDALAAGDDTLAARAAIGLLRVLGFHLVRTQEALGWAAVARALLERLGRTEGLDAAALANNTGLAYQSAERLDEALRWHQRALALREAALGPDHPEAAHSYGNLGNLYAARKQYQEARAWHERALAVRTAALGPGHPETALSHHNLGRMYLDEGQVELALPQLRRALEIFEPIGVRHPVTARILHNLGKAEELRGQLPAALEDQRRALEIQRPLLGDDHPDTLRTRQAIARLCDDGHWAACTSD